VSRRDETENAPRKFDVPLGFEFKKQAIQNPKGFDENGPCKKVGFRKTGL